MTPNDFQNLIDASMNSPEWQVPLVPQPEHWHRLAWLKWRDKQHRSIGLTKAEDVFRRNMDMLAAAPEFRAEADKHIREFNAALRARRVLAMKGEAEKLREGLKDWGVPLAKARQHMTASLANGDNADFRARVGFESKYGKLACDEAYRELRALDKLEAEIAAIEAEPLGTLGSADEARRAERVKNARAQTKGEPVAV
ncbi:MAG: hypothetical protein KDB68_10950 [Planctomycetes bacterium]|nr:hypothetical protein [Planctomycetota bacterium]